ncbi:rust resistance kinase Lr10-like isoform X1 [Citrus sinensis]|uniref:rust resistance kinase Lr10-like isoform X1 n=1 Tax=Citrus sinensis TaxID=2711 RepID=UPI002278DC67|nr:rust resistance kinase Lr10-like isoform X1 [Citrus sinensis]
MSLVMSLIILFLFLLYTCTLAKASAEDNKTDKYEFCQPTRCSNKSPRIRYPFRLKAQPTYCGLEGFELSCLSDKTILHFPSSGDYYVHKISYLDSSITITDVNETACPFQSLISFNLTNSKFFFLHSNESYALYNCTEKVSPGWTSYGLIGLINFLSNENNLVYTIDSESSVEDMPPSCRKSGTVEIPGGLPLQDIATTARARPVVLGWEALDGCYDCENSGNYCGFNTTSNSTICVAVKHQKHGPGPLSISLISTGTSIGGITLFALVIFLIYRSRESEKEKETQLKVEKFLENYRTVNPTRYTYKELKKITSRFKHRLGQGGYGSVFRGKLFNGIPVAVKMLEHLKGNGQEFINEVATIGRIHHFHIVRLLGFCSEGTRRALVYEFMPNGSLEKFIFSKTNSSSHRPLSWEKLKKIAFGVARGVEYLHQGCNQRILHFDIKPHNILLDHNFQPKISDFGLAKLCSKDISIVSLTAARGTAGYIAPELFSRNFGEVSYKSDVYSYGMMLLEMVGCRKNKDPAVEIQSQIYFPEWIYNRMRQGQELCLEFEEDGDEGIARKLAIVALWCIQWNPTERPSMPIVLQMLEADLQSLEIPPMPFVSSDVETGAIN